MAFATPGNQSPGGGFRAAPYSRAFTAAAVLSTQVSQAPNSSSGAILIVTTVSPTFAYKDAAGTTVTVTLGATPAGVIIDFKDVSMSEIVTLTNATLVVYWHGSGS
jgi:ABC-type Zn uptake system ZnuABC Zn-binding protein ZnuA